jgi:hypothetical protein
MSLKVDKELKPLSGRRVVRCFGFTARFNRLVQPLATRVANLQHTDCSTAVQIGMRTSSFKRRASPFCTATGQKLTGGNSPLHPLPARHHIEIERDSRVA